MFYYSAKSQIMWLMGAPQTLEQIIIVIALSSHISMWIRSALGALDVNCNASRAQSTTSKGALRWRIKVCVCVSVYPLTPSGGVCAFCIFRYGKP